MKTNWKQRGKILFALCACFALALTVLVGIGFTKPETAYAEATAKQKLTTPIDANETDIDQMEQYGYAYYYNGNEEYGQKTLVLDGLNMETAGGSGGEAILFHSGAATLFLKDGSTNRIKVLTPQSNVGYVYSTIYSYGSLIVRGSGSLIIEYVDQTINIDMGCTLSAISVKENATFAHTGSVTVTTKNIRIITDGDDYFSRFNVCNSEEGGVVYSSGDLFLNAGSYYSQVGQDAATEQPKAYTMFHTENSNVTLNMTRATGGSIGWTTVDTDQNTLSFYDGASAPSGIDTSGVSLLGGSSPDSLTQVATIDDLNRKKSAKVGYAPLHTHTFVYEITKQPTATETGTAEGFCADDGASDTLTLPVLTDTTVYSKVSHEATSQADAYDQYTYSKGGVVLSFPVVHADTKLPAGGGDNNGGDNNGGNTNGGDKAGLSGGAIAGIAIGSTVGVLLIVYILGYFLFFAKGKLAGTFFTAIYKPMSKLFKK